MSIRFSFLDNLKHFFRRWNKSEKTNLLKPTKLTVQLDKQKRFIPEAGCESFITVQLHLSRT